jgi:hypothetical protein
MNRSESSCAGLTRASNKIGTRPSGMDCRVKPGNDAQQTKSPAEIPWGFF